MSTERMVKRRRLSPPGEDEIQRKISKQQNTIQEPSSNRTSKVKHSANKTHTKHSTIIEEDLPAVKGLDSSDPSTRRKTLTSILTHLSNRSAQSPLSKTQCLQLWRGFHVVTYMHDSRNMISVQNLLHELAGTFSTISAKDDETEDLSDPWLKPYHEAFWETIVREWSGIDSHRMNKYLLLIRLVMRQLFAICIAPIDNELNSELAQSKATSMLQTLNTVGPLNPKDLKIPNGLRLHVLDVWADELSNSLSATEEKNDSEEEPVSDAAIQFVADFFRKPLSDIAASASGAPKVVRNRAKDVLADLDEKLSDVSEEKDEADEGEPA